MTSSFPDQPFPCIILTNGLLDGPFAKTAHGLLRGSKRFRPLAVIDPVFAGQDAGEVMDGKHLGIPIYETVAAFLEQNQTEKPHFCVVGVALPGGKLPDVFRAELLFAIQQGISVANGLHSFLTDDPTFVHAAEEHQVTIIDVRKARPREQLHFWQGAIYEVNCPRIAILGIDCAVGKRTTCQWLLQACQRANIKAEMIYTGQTGWMQGHRYGFILDSTVNDFVSGEIEHAIVQCAKEAKPDVILIEGQSALRNPSGPCGSEFLLSGDVKYVILQHAPGRQHYEDTPVPLGSVATEIDLIRFYGATVIALTLNEENLSQTEAVAAQQELQAALNIPVLRPLHEGVDALIPVVQQIISKS